MGNIKFEREGWKDSRDTWLSLFQSLMYWSDAFYELY
jgi:hypothetical protein